VDIVLGCILEIKMITGDQCSSGLSQPVSLMALMIAELIDNMNMLCIKERSIIP